MASEKIISTFNAVLQNQNKSEYKKYIFLFLSSVKTSFCSSSRYFVKKIEAFNKVGKMLRLKKFLFVGKVSTLTNSYLPFLAQQKRCFNKAFLISQYNQRKELLKSKLM